MKKSNWISTIICCGVLLGCVYTPTLQAQSTYTYRNKQNTYLDGKEAFLQGKFTLASELFTQYLGQPEAKTAYAEEAEFLILVSDLYAEKEHAADELKAYTEQKHNDYWINQAWFYLGDVALSAEDYKEATKCFKKVDEKRLPKNLKREFAMKNGLVLLQNDKLPQAYKSLKKVTEDPKSPYVDDANYYCGYIHYMSGEYDEADTYFNKVRAKKYSESIEHYQLQQEFLKGDFEETQKRAVKMFKKSDGEFKAEIARILGYINYTENDVKSAAEYYEVYQKNIEKLSREDIYLLGESYFAMEEYKKAADAFTKVATLEDELSQNAYNKLAACYIHLDDKQMARMAFESASRYNFNKTVQEEALFNYCQLTYELSYSPFNEIIGAIERFLKEFPDSEYTPQVYSLLTEVFLNTNNYEKAYQSLKNLNIDNPKLVNAMQRIAYYRAIELFNNTEFEASLEYFTLSLANSAHDKALKSEAHYWRGEAYFRLHKFDEAIADYNAFMQSGYASRLAEFKVAHYSLGYAYFKLNQPGPAIVWFSKFVSLQKNTTDARLADSYNRLGDCYYLNREFATAVKYYDYNIDMGLNSSDYAYYQKAFCLGLQKNYTGKVDALNMLTRLFQTSAYLDDAYFEKGRAFTMMDQKANALHNYQTLVDKFPESVLRSKALVNMALIHYNADEANEASKIYKKVINEYPRSEEASTSLNALKTIAIDNNSVDEFLRYTKQLGNRVTVGNNNADSLTYISAERLYMKGNVENSSKYFADYIAKYPNGKYVLNAHYYKADCHLRMSQLDQALQEYQAIVKYPTNEYTEEALSKLARVYYDKEKYDEALPYYKRLVLVAKNQSNVMDAKVGVLRCKFKMERWDEVLSAVSMVMDEPQLSDEIRREAYFYKGKSLLQKGRNADALAAFQQIYEDTRNEFGAEAKYRVAQIYYQGGQADKAVAEVKDYIKKNTPHQYWLAKSFIVMAKVMIDKGDDFNAKQSLMSVKDNYEGNDEVQEEVAKLLYDIDAREAQRYQQKRDSLMKLLNDSAAQ